MKQDSGCAFEQHAFRTDLPTRISRRCPFPGTKHPVSRSRRSSRSSTAAAIPSRRRSATTSTCTRPSSRTGTTRSPARCACAAPASGGSPRCSLMPLGNDRCGGRFTVDRPGRWQFAVSAWTDRVATWQDELRRKVDGGQQDLAGELAEGAVLLGRESLTAEEGLAADAGDRHGVTTSRRSRSTSTASSRASARGTSSSRARSAGFAGVDEGAAAARRARLRRRVPAADPPDRSHEPQGQEQRASRTPKATSARRGRSAPRRAATTRCIRISARGRTSTRSIAAARTSGIEIALDFAIQCSPDHPWLKEHPEWFNRRPDGTLKYAENPPKRYQDIYNVNFESEDWRGLWQALLDVVARLGRARRHRVPRRQPAHEAGRVLGVADPRGARPSIPR